MLTPLRGAGANTLDSILQSPSSSRLTTPTNSSDSFAQQLINSLESYLQQSSSDLQGAAQLEIVISPKNSPDTGTRQFLITVKKSAASAPATTATSAAMVLGTFSSQASQATQASQSSPAATFTDEADAYWAMQPPAVQALRNIPDRDERWAKGRELAQQGFAIDTSIMLDNQDPYMTMKIRKDEGYTWIPSLGQGGVMNRPGFSFPGMAPYDPMNPPAGSVHVSTDFANGLESTSPWSGIPRSKT